LTPVFNSESNTFTPIKGKIPPLGRPKGDDLVVEGLSADQNHLVDRKPIIVFSMIFVIKAASPTKPQRTGKIQLFDTKTVDRGLT